MSLSNYDIKYKLDKIEEDIKREAWLNKLTKKSNPPIEKWQTQAKELQNKSKGFNIYAAIAGLIIYHTTYICTKNILVNEMGINRFMKHSAICLTISLASGYLVGELMGKNPILKNRTDNLVEKFKH